MDFLTNISSVSNIAIHAVVLAARKDNNVPTGAALHHRGARLLTDHLLCSGGAAWTHAAHDQDVQ